MPIRESHAVYFTQCWSINRSQRIMIPYYLHLFSIISILTCSIVKSKCAAMWSRPVHHFIESSNGSRSCMRCHHLLTTVIKQQSTVHSLEGASVTTVDNTTQCSSIQSTQLSQHTTWCRLPVTSASHVPSDILFVIRQDILGALKEVVA